MASNDDVKRYELLHQEYQYRHHTFWVSFNLWGGLVLASLGYGFVREGFLERGWFVLALPMIGLLLSLFAAYHLHAEVRRLHLVDEALAPFMKVRSAKEPDGIISVRDKLVSLSIGKVMANLFAYVLAPACLVSAWLQMSILGENLSDEMPLGWLVAFGIAVFLLVIAWATGQLKWKDADDSHPPIADEKQKAEE